MTGADVDEIRMVGTAVGRTLEVHVRGRATDFPLVFHHGTPGSGYGLPAILAAAARHGLLSVAVTRPGYGESTARPGRRVADVAVDVAGVLDDLGAERCVVAGWSGGGPHALACGALLPERVPAVVVIAGIAPWRADGLDWFGGFSEFEQMEFRAAARGASSLRELLAPMAEALRRADPAQLQGMLAESYPPADQTAVASCSSAFARTFAHGVVHGVEGWVEDDLAFVAPWGFDLADLTVPTTLWFGTEDPSAVAHGRWLAERLPDPRAHLAEGEGHLSIGLNCIDAMLDELVGLVA